MRMPKYRGLATHGHMHWRGDRVEGFFPSVDPVGDEKVSFKNFIVAMVGLVGGDIPPTNPALQDDMDDFADFMLEVFLPPNPVLDLANSLNGNEGAGLLFFLGLDGPSSGGPGGLHGSDGAPFFQSPPLGFTCEGCHRLDDSQGFFGTGGQASFENEPQIMKIPHLRNAYQKVGMFGMPNTDFNLPGAPGQLLTHWYSDFQMRRPR